MTTIQHVTLEVSDLGAATGFYSSALGPVPQLRLTSTEAATSGFRGFTLSLVVSQPASVDSLLDAAVAGGARVLRAARKQFWGGYSGVVLAPDGTILKIATSAGKNSGPASRSIDRVTLILGVADMKLSRQFYAGRGFAVAKSFGSKYVEFAAPDDAVMLALYKRSGLAKDAAVAVSGSGSHRIAIGSDAGHFRDPDGFAWNAAAGAGGDPAASHPAQSRPRG
jgi:catechol 2,3-dioxygenase-like lactoylglutathione lyase family enzyme